MSGTSRYCIRDDYVENSAVSTMDHLSGVQYWNAARVKASSYFQYDVYRYVERLAIRLKACTLVDVGCGVGTKLVRINAKIPSLNIYGIDQPSAIEYCRANYAFGTWIADDFENPGDIERPVDPEIIVCSDVIEHVADPDRLIEYIKSISGRDTRVVISTPERDRMRGEDCTHCPHPQHVREWNAAEFRAYLESQSFIIVESFFVPPYKLNLNPIFLRYELQRLISGLPRANNQVALLRLA